MANHKIIHAIRFLIARLRLGEKYLFLDAHLEDMPYGALIELHQLLQKVAGQGEKQTSLFPDSN